MLNNSHTSLAKCTVLVTRPQHQTAELCALIHAAGGKSIHFPVMDIIPVEQQEDQYRCDLSVMIDGLSHYDIAIFISANAVEQGVARLQLQKILWPAHLQLAVVGRGSALALTAVGLKAAICPQQGFNSEALLALSSMQHMQGKKIIIFRGVGGRERLALELRQRGAQVDYAEVYYRRRAKVNLLQLQKSGQLKQINAIIVASNESLQYLYDIAGSTYRDWLLKSPLAVISRRSARLATELGFGHIGIASEASNQGMFEAIRQNYAQLLKENTHVRSR